MSQVIHKQIDLKAPPAKVWDALTDSKKFGAWFGVNMDDPFVVGKEASGFLAVPGYEHLKLTVKVREMQKEKLFSFNWHPYAIDTKVDYSKEEPTLVSFKLESSALGTLLTIEESGFEKIPENRRFEAFRSNEGGWAAQIRNIEKYLA